MRKHKRWERIIAAVLAVIIIFGAGGFEALAASENMEGTISNAAKIPDMELQTEAGDSMGTLIGNTLSGEMEQDKGNDEGYSIIDLSVEGIVATVEYSALEDSEIVVAVYEDQEEPRRMLASGKAVVSKDETISQIIIETDCMPEHFIVKAFLMDTENHNPRCEALESNLYTKEMQEFLDKTVDDFGEDQVLNLDEENTTNFAVFSSDTMVIDEESEKNQINSNGAGIYTVTNADSSFTSLKKGDVFSYNYEDGTVLIVKVSSIQVDGTTVTITEDSEAELSDVFDYVRIEETDDGTNAAVDNDSLEEGVSYIENEETNRSKSRAIEIGDKFGKKFTYAISKKEGDFSIKGSVGIAINTTVKVYIAEKSQYVEVKLDTSVPLEIKIKGKWKAPIALGKISIRLAAGVSIEFTPSFLLQTSGTVEYRASFTTTAGFSYDGKKGFVSKCTAPKLKSDGVKIEASIFLGISMEPKICILSERVTKASIKAMAGIEIKGKLAGGEETTASRHLCQKCIEGTISAKAKISGEIELLNHWGYSYTMMDLSVKIGDFYYSMDQSQGGFSKCPFYMYKITLTVKDKSGNPVTGAEINGTELPEKPITNKDGQTVFYLGKGTYNLSFATDSYRGKKEIVVGKKEKKVLMTAKKKGESGGGEGDEDVIDGGDFKQLKWSLNDNGTLIISGEGELIHDYDKAPWDKYKENIESIIIEEGVTYVSGFDNGYSSLIQVTIPGSVSTIGTWAFRGCTSLETVIVEEGVTEIWGGAFEGCCRLSDIIIPKSVTAIIGSVFKDCVSLKEITIPEGVTSIESELFSGCTNLTRVNLPEGITSIDIRAFENCGLTDITIPAGVSTINKATFSGCTNLTNVTIPEGVISIGEMAFMGCDSLTELTIPEGVANIGEAAFCGCGSLTELTIPEGVTSIEPQLFSWCTNLTEVNLPAGITSIGQGAFHYCESLAEFTIPEGVTSIDACAFMGCVSLTELTIPERVTSIDSSQLFSECTNLAKVNLPTGITSIGYQAFYGCSSLKSIIIPEKVTSIEENAFWGCGLEEIYFRGNVSEINIDPCTFSGVGITAYYPDMYECPVGSYGGNLTWIAYSLEQGQALPNNENPIDNEDINSFDGEDSAIETATAEAVQYNTNGKQTILKSVSLLFDSGTSSAVSSKDLAAGESYILAVVKDENAEELLSADNLLFIEQKTADENGMFSLSYIPRDDEYSKAELLFGARYQERELNELYDSIQAAQKNDIVRADIETASILPRQIMEAAMEKQAELNLAVRDGIYWKIDGNLLSAEQIQDLELNVARVGKENGAIPTEVIERISTKHDAEQLNFGQKLQSPAGISFGVKAEDALKEYKCVIFQYDESGEAAFIKSCMAKNGVIEIGGVDRENYLLVYGRKGDINGDKKISMVDLMRVLHHISGRNTLEVLGKELADIDLNGRVNMTDLMKILHYVSGRREEL